MGHSPAVRSPGAATAVGRGYKHPQAVVLQRELHQNMWCSNWTVSEIVKKYNNSVTIISTNKLIEICIKRGFKENSQNTPHILFTSSYVFCLLFAPARII